LSIELLLLYLLLPVAAYSGWRIGRRKQNPIPAQKSNVFSAEYFTGLNFLLNEQPDKAVDVFIKMLEVDSETVETHLALGNLFRRRGEGDRAIRIHQNLIARPTLSKEQRAQALFELGNDYMRAGFLDRAENLFLELIEGKSHKIEALNHLLDIYQQEQDWEKAIVTAKKIEANTGVHTGAVAAHFCCELAAHAQAAGETRQAVKTLKRALANDKGCVRANILLGHIEKENHNYKGAIKVFRQIEQQDPVYLSEVLGAMYECHQALGTLAEYERYLHRIQGKYEGVSVVLFLAELTRLRYGEEEAAYKIIEALRKRPSIKGLHRLIELNLVGSEGAVRENLLILQDLTSKLLQDNSVYKCQNCGFKAKTLHWKCPTCKTWGSIKPIVGVEGE